jgi:hypothetical protein
MPGRPASPKKSAQSDQAKAAITPTLTRVSMVAAPWRAFTAAARWKGQAPQTATGDARVSASHCQFVNCRAGTIESTTTGRARAALTRVRWRRASTSAARASAAPAVEPSAASAGDAGGAGTVAPYPAAATVAMSASTSGTTGSPSRASPAAPATTRTCAFSVA